MSAGQAYELETADAARVHAMIEGFRQRGGMARLVAVARAILNAEEGEGEAARIPPSPDPAITGRPAKGPDGLTDRQRAILTFMCDWHDSGRGELRPRDLREAFGLKQANLRASLVSMEIGDMIEVDQKGHKHVILYPLRRPDGRAYDPEDRA